MISLQKGAKTHQLQKTANLHQAKTKQKQSLQITRKRKKLRQRIYFIYHNHYFYGCFTYQHEIYI